MNPRAGTLGDPTRSQEAGESLRSNERRRSAGHQFQCRLVESTGRAEVYVEWRLTTSTAQAIDSKRIESIV